MTEARLFYNHQGPSYPLAVLVPKRTFLHRAVLVHGSRSPDPSSSSSSHVVTTSTEVSTNFVQAPPANTHLGLTRTLPCCLQHLWKMETQVTGSNEQLPPHSWVMIVPQNVP